MEDFLVKVSKFLGGNSTVYSRWNQKQVFEQSGVFTVPKSGIFYVLGIGGGALQNTYGDYPIRAKCTAGGGGKLKLAKIELLEGEEITVEIGAGGSGGNIDATGGSGGNAGGDTKIILNGTTIFKASGGFGGTACICHYGIYTNVSIGNPLDGNIATVEGGQYFPEMTNMNSNKETFNVLSLTTLLGNFNDISFDYVNANGRNYNDHNTFAGAGGGLDGAGGGSIYNPGGDATANNGIGFGAGGGYVSQLSQTDYALQAGDGKSGKLILYYFED